MADIAHIAGLIAGKALKNPFDFGFDIMTSTTHKTLRGPRGGIIMVREDLDIFKKINSAVFPGLQGGPHMNNISGMAISFKEASSESFEKYAENIIKNAKAMANIFEKNNVKMISNGTENHLILIDTLKSFNKNGAEAESILEEIGITVNKNMIFNDSGSALKPSGIRIGTPAITTRGFNVKESQKIAQIIVDALKNSKNNFEEVKKLKKEVFDLAEKFKIPESFL
jgi:glycine hydroxymethyltransferase